MIVQIFDRSADLAASLASEILARIQRTPALVLGLATGHTPIPLYRELRERSLRSLSDWSQVRTFNLDEFVGAGEAGSRYRRFMHEQLFDHVNLEAGHVHLLDGRAAILEEECARYETAIERAGGLDLQILGVGVNGHIGFNEPGDELLARTHVARLEEPTRQNNAWLFGDEIARVPSQALSIGMATIFRAREIVLLATGVEKAPAVQQLIAGPITPRLPASFLQMHPNVRVLLDEPAARLSRR